MSQRDAESIIRTHMGGKILTWLPVGWNLKLRYPNKLNTGLGLEKM